VKERFPIMVDGHKSRRMPCAVLVEVMEVNEDETREKMGEGDVLGVRVDEVELMNEKRVCSVNVSDEQVISFTDTFSTPFPTTNTAELKSIPLTFTSCISNTPLVILFSENKMGSIHTSHREKTIPSNSTDLPLDSINVPHPINPLTTNVI